MKPSKLLVFVLLLLIPTFTFIFIFSNKPLIYPQSDQELVDRQLRQSLNDAGLNFGSILFKEYLNTIEFYLVSSDSPLAIRVVFSDKKNIPWQVSSLQKIIKTAKIKNKHPQTVDLSIDHPYATLKNN